MSQPYNNEYPYASTDQQTKAGSFSRGQCETDESEVAEIHRMYWNYEADCGLLKIHFPPLGIVGFVFKGNECIGDFNFLSQKIIDFWCEKFRQQGHVLCPGYQIDRDVEKCMIENPQDGLYLIHELELGLKVSPKRQFLLPTGWKDFRATTPHIEYAPCNSVLL